MTTLFTTPPAARSASPLLPILATLQFVLMFAAFFVLGSAINWPQSLDLPPREALPLIRQQAPAVMLGYSLYFLSAFLLIPLALVVRASLVRQGHRSTLLSIATAFGMLAGGFKLLGIVRWLVAMPVLAELHLKGDAQTQASVEVAYTLLNSYAGGVGEVLGVQLFSGLWTLLVSILLLQQPAIRWMGFAGLVSALLLFVGLLEVYGVGVGGAILTVQGIFWQVWLLVLGGVLLRSGKVRL